MIRITLEQAAWAYIYLSTGAILRFVGYLISGE